MRDLPAADAELLLAADPASNITEAELARSRARSLAFVESDVTHIFAGGPEPDHHQRKVGRRHLAGGILAAAAVSAAVLTAGLLQAPRIEAPAATASASSTGTPSAATTVVDPGQEAPSGPLHVLFASADEVLVLEALRNPAWNGSLQAGLGVEPVNVLQVLKGSRALGETSLDVASANGAESGTLLWQHTQREAPMTYLAFFARSVDGEMHLMQTEHSLLQVRNIRTAATVDPFTDDPVDIGDDLRSRIDVAPDGDVPVATYPGGQPKGSGTDVILGTEGPGGSREGLVRGYVSPDEACFTFENSIEKFYLRWPVGYTAAVRLLPVNAEGRVSFYGTVQADTPVILNEWGFIYMTNLHPRPLVTGWLTAETAFCAGEALPVFDVMPERVGASPFQKGRGVALPTS